jgi:hypothetical protein
MQNLAGASLDFKAAFSKTALIAALKANKEAHCQDFDRAREVYFVDLRQRLSDLTDSAHDAIFREDSYSVDYYGKLKPPVNASKLYDQYIALLDRCVSETIELSPSDYNAIVNDEWDWAKAAKATNSTYSSKWRP